MNYCTSVMFPILLASRLNAGTLEAPSDNKVTDWCEGPEIQSMAVALFPDRSPMPQYSYKFQVHQPNGADAPTIVALPGGPGQRLIGSPAMHSFVPQGFNAIFTDQRGSGCNAAQDEPFPDDAYQSRYFAQDVISMIKQLKLRNYVLYGHSYGTIHGTITTALIEALKEQGDDIELPKALILEGPIGRAFQAGEALPAYQNEWLNAKARIKPEVQHQLNGTLLPFAELGDIESRWGYFIQRYLFLGLIPASAHMPVKDLATLIDGLSGSRAELAHLEAELKQSEFEGYGLSFRLLGCREFLGDFPAQMKLSAGRLIGVGNHCEGLSLERPYDSRDFILQQVPIYYFVGSMDQATPPWQGSYHRQQQTEVETYYVTVDGAAHLPLQFSLLAAQCKRALWDSMLHEGLNFSAALRSCQWPWPIIFEQTPGLTG